jgi:hypothetical protein
VLNENHTIAGRVKFVNNSFGRDEQQTERLLAKDDLETADHGVERYDEQT